jgi:microcystin degradation protein MlrC
MRHSFKVEGESCSVSEALKRASLSSTRPVFISDSGDNITAGAPGDGINFIDEAREFKAGRILYAQLYSPEAVSSCQARAIGETVAVSIGKTALQGAIKAKTKSTISSVGKDEEFTVILLQTPFMEILITDKRFPIADPAQFIEFGAPLLDYDIVIFKLGYLMPALRDLATRHIMAISEGCTTLNLSTLNYKRLEEPLFPIRDDFEPEFKVCP